MQLLLPVDMLNDYEDEAKLRLCMDAVNDPEDPSMLTRYFTMYSLLPDLKDQIVLDLPGGQGHKARKFITQYGAKKVIAVDIMEKQLELSRKIDLEAGIKPGQIEYVIHDAKQPKLLAASLTDHCVCSHLFCHAHDYTELLAMCRCIYLNLRPGGACYSIMCTLNSDDQLVRKFEDFDAKIFHVDPWQEDFCNPRKFRYINKDFNYDVRVWTCDTVCQALKETGFSKVELHPYQGDPSYVGNIDLSLYITVVNGNVIVGTK